MKNKELFKQAIENETGKAILHIVYEGFKEEQNVFLVIFEDGSSSYWNCWRGEDNGINTPVEVSER